MVEKKKKVAKKVEEIGEKEEAVKKEKTKKENVDSMESLIEKAGDSLLPYREGEIVDAKVLSVSRNKIWVDVQGLSLGYVPEKEITLNSDIKVGDTITSYVILLEDEDGNVVLSLKRADREKYWKDMEERYKTGEPVEITVNEANKGGLISEIGGIPGFLPVSQLSPEHYPRVSGGDREEILSRLSKLIGEKIYVKVINCDKASNKLIFSEKAVDAEKLASKIEKYKVGDAVEALLQEADLDRTRGMTQHHSQCHQNAAAGAQHSHLCMWWEVKAQVHSDMCDIVHCAYLYCEGRCHSTKRH